MPEPLPQQRKPKQLRQEKQPRVSPSRAQAQRPCVLHLGKSTLAARLTLAIRHALAVQSKVQPTPVALQVIPTIPRPAQL
ncbi:hypothetical protein ACFX10_014367 [Malus domestica]